MPTRSFSELSAHASEVWSEDTRQFAEEVGRQLKAEMSAQQMLGRELRAAREEAHLTQPALADIANVQQAEISRIERGLGNPTRDTLVRLASAVGKRVSLVPAQP